MKYNTYYEENSEISKYKYMKLINYQYEQSGKYPGKEFTVRKLKFYNPAESILTQRTDVPRYYMTMRNPKSKSIYLEKKTIQNQMTYKASAKISRDECNRILGMDIDWMKSHKNELVRDFYLQIKINGIKPGYITDYRREILQLDKKDMLIFDKQISRAAGNCVDFFSEEMIMINCLGRDQVSCTLQHQLKIPAVVESIIYQEEYSPISLPAIGMI